MLHLALAFQTGGARVTIGCSQEFRAAIVAVGLEFTEVVINKNANQGVAAETKQAAAEQARLDEFIQATYLGAVTTLLTQAHHRTDDMLANPEELIDRIRIVQQEMAPDLWVVDQLSYGVTLALLALGLPFISFCPPHPASIPDATGYFGVPAHWPSGFEVSAEEQQELVSLSQQVELLFAKRWNEVIVRKNLSIPPVQAPFHLTSPTGVIFNYPDFHRQQFYWGTVSGPMASAPQQLHGS